MKKAFLTIDHFIENFSKKMALKILRAAFALIYIWFGILKVLDKSPIEEVVRLSTPFLPIENFPTILGFWEMLIGGLFVFKRTNKAAVILFLIKIPGTFLPLFFATNQAFVQAPFEPTLVGQYIFKNLILIPAALLIYSKKGS